MNINGLCRIWKASAHGLGVGLVVSSEKTKMNQGGDEERSAKRKDRYISYIRADRRGVTMRGAMRCD